MAFNVTLGYDPEKDYSLAILAAKSEDERKLLRRERENKILDKYGGIDPYKGEHVDIIRGYTDPAGEYLNSLYAEKTAAELASLAAAYEKNTAGEKASLEAIAPRYYEARNEAVRASEKGKRDFALYGAAHGLNTGAAGQAELARSVSLQGDLADLRLAELSETAQGEAKLRELEREYELSRAAAKAQGDRDLAEARYEEFLRRSEAEAAEEKWRAELSFKEADSQREVAMALLKAGAMPSADTLAAGGISASDAKAYLAAYRAAQAAKNARKTSSSSSKKSGKEKTEEDADRQDYGDIASYDELSPAAKSLYTSCLLQMRRNGYPHITDQMRTNIFEANFYGTITNREYQYIMYKLQG